ERDAETVRRQGLIARRRPGSSAPIGARSQQQGTGVSARFCTSEEETMPEGTTKNMASADAQDLTDGFHLLIDALKLNGLTTIYNVPGIPITDFGRMAQASGLRVLSFRHEQNAGYAAAMAGFLTKKPGVCLTVSAPGFLNGLTALAHATTNCFPMILMSGSS